LSKSGYGGALPQEIKSILGYLEGRILKHTLRDLEFGPTVTLGVDSVSLRNPSEPVTGSLEAAAFVSTISTPLRAYVTSADQAEWHRENHQAARNMMLFFLAASILMLFVRTPRRSSPAPPARQRASFG
jgi:hypothetical protein